MDSLYLPAARRVAPDVIEAADGVKEKYEVVEMFKKALKKPKFMVKKIKERDCPIHSRWCSAVDVANADAFMEAFVDKVRKEDPSVSPFTVLEEITVVYPTVKTMDMLQMLNNRNSFKSECLQWTGYSESFTKRWSDMELKRFVMSIALQIFLKKFDAMPGLVKLFEDINELRKAAAMNEDDPEAVEYRVLNASNIIKQAVFSGWFKRVEESVSSLGDFRGIKRAAYTMVEYKQALGMLPYEYVEGVKKKGRWINPVRKIPDPFNIIILKNGRDNSYSCWNFKTNSEVLLLFDKFGVPFDTKLGQLLKAEYTYAELFTKQNGAHLSDGYILSEMKDEPPEDDEDELTDEYKRALRTQRDKDDNELWKRQLESLDDTVRYEDTNGGHPARIVLSGVARPPRLPYLSKDRGGGGGKGGKGGGGGDKSDPASDLVKMLQKQITTGERAAQDIAKMLKSTVSDENAYLKGASKKLEDLLSSKHDFIAKIHKNLDAVTKEIDGITEETGSDCPADGFGVVPIRKMISSMAGSMATVHDMVERLEVSMAAVGVNPAANTETDMFREMDTRISALTGAANHKTCMEMRKIVEVVNTMMDRMEAVVNTHTSSLTVPADTHERMCMDDLAFNMEDFDDEFAGVFKGPGEVSAVTLPKKGGDASTELYAEYHSKMKEANDMYKTLKNNYTALVKNFQAFQVDTLKKVSKIDVFKSNAVDARNLMIIYKKYLAAQIKMNKEGMTKIEGVLQDLEVKMNKINHTRVRDNESNKATLENIQGDLRAILASADDPLDDLEDAVVRSDGVLTNLREQRVDQLARVSDTFRVNLEELRRTFPMAEESRDNRKRRLMDEAAEGGGGGGGASTSAGSWGGGGASTSAGSWDNVDAINRSIGTTYGEALEDYHKMVDSVSDAREKALAEAELKDLERRKRVEEAKVKRESAMQERGHLMAMKRYGDILTGKEEAKKRKRCGGTHEAEAVTVGKLRPMPQMLVVKDHFRKAKIMPGVPEKHMGDTRKMLRARWDDFVHNLFPLVTTVDNHGVKTWGVNEEAVAATTIIPFMKIRYGLKSPERFSSGLSANTTMKAAFNTMCDEFVTELLLHSDEYRHLMTVFKPAHLQRSSKVIKDYDGGGGGGGDFTARDPFA